jgi:hypothetical protein
LLVGFEYKIDNVGTVNLVDAAVSAGVKKFVLISSILTNGRVIGQVLGTIKRNSGTLGYFDGKDEVRPHLFHPHEWPGWTGIGNIQY